METTRRKALYIFLSCILGILLFTMFHRAVFVIYEIIGSFYPAVTWLHQPFRTIATIDFSTFLLALFVGGWYGTWIGLNWYKLIYEERGVKTWFHGFIPHHFRNRKHKKQEADSDLDFINSIAQKSSKGKTAPKRIVVTSTPAVRSETFRSFRTSQPAMPWDSEDTQLEPKTAKRVVRKRIVKKVTKKTVAKKRQTV